MTYRNGDVESTVQRERFVLLTGRTIYQGVGKEQGKLSDEYLNSVAICEMDPEDMSRMMITENSSVRVTTSSGSVIVKVVKSIRAPQTRILFMPYGPWASLIMPSKTNGTGMPSLKGVPATIEAAPKDKVLTVRELLDAHYRAE
ncbi:MAG: molybdopterin dinucleotide binding domain-containing protein [Candidatus Bathyarchaeia archaeon]